MKTSRKQLYTGIFQRNDDIDVPYFDVLNRLANSVPHVLDKPVKHDRKLR